jgi:hypothetical protein
MGKHRCPGQDRRYWKPEDIFEEKCPRCGFAVELWKDEGVGRCSNCGTAIVNPRVAQGCAQWCKFAKECMGLVPGAGGDTFTTEQKLIGFIKETFGEGSHSFRHSLDVLGWAKRIMENEGGEPLVVKASAILHEMAGEAKNVDPDEKSLSPEKSALIQSLMERAGIAEPVTEEVKHVITRFTCGHGQKRIEFLIFSDAHALSELKEAQVSGRDTDISDFHTKSGKSFAEALERRHN